jgi:predicted nucleic acid-binding protein
LNEFLLDTNAAIAIMKGEPAMLARHAGDRRA